MRIRSFAPDSVFIDTSAHFALAATRDVNYEAAGALFTRVVRERRLLYTTNFILAETHALLLARLRRAYTAAEARARARDNVERLYRSSIVVERVTVEDEARALVLLRRFTDQDFSFTDTTSFAVMERLGIRIAFTFDDDFQKAGFTDLRHVLP